MAIRPFRLPTLWRVAAIWLALGLALASYLWYCQTFWDDYYENYFTNRPEDYYDFRPTVPLPQNIALDKGDLARYTWGREILEPMHGQWINETELRFPNDSTLEVTVRPGYVQDNYLLYPVFRRLIVSNQAMRDTFTLDKERLMFPSRWVDEGGADSVAIELNRASITIDYSFL